MLKNIFIITISLLCGCIFGFWGYLFLAKNLSLSDSIVLELNPIEIIQILINVLLTIFIASILNRKNEEKRVEKDLLLKFFTEFNDEFTRSFKVLLFKQNLKLIAVTSHIKRFRMRFESIIKLAQTHGFLKEKTSEVLSTKEKFTDIRDLLTDTPQRTETAANGVVVQSGALILGHDTVDKVVDIIFEMNRFIFKIMVDMNRAK